MMCKLFRQGFFNADIEFTKNLSFFQNQELEIEVELKDRVFILQILLFAKESSFRMCYDLKS